MQRREFLLQSSAVLAGLWLAPRAFALGFDDEYFLQLTVPNGWDVLLAMDPWIDSKRPEASELFIDYRADELVRVGDLTIGPALAPLKSHLARFAIVNGIFVSKTSIDHVALRNYMMTGSGSGTKAAAAVEYLASQTRAPAWGLVTDDAVPSGAHTIVKSAVSSLKDLAPVSGNLDRVSEAKTQLEGALNDYLSGLKLEKIYRDVLTQLKAEKTDAELARAQIIAAAFKAGLSKAAALSIQPLNGLNTLDTHTNHENHHRASLTDVFRQIAAVLDVLKSVEVARGVSLLDRITVYVSSEFSRTPGLNNSRGKDHNAFTNSALLMGPRVTGGQVIGGSKLLTRAEAQAADSLHVAQYLDPKSGRAIGSSAELDRGRLLKPETVVANVLRAAGLRADQLDADLRGEPTLTAMVRV